MSYTRREFGVLLSGALAAETVGATPCVRPGRAGACRVPPAARGPCWTSPTGATTGTASSMRPWLAERSSTDRRCTSSTGFPRPCGIPSRSSCSRRLRAGHRLDQHARRPQGLGFPVSRAGLRGLPGRSARAGAEPASSVHPRIQRSAGADLRRRRPADWLARTPDTRSGREQATRPTRRSHRWSRPSGSRWPTTRSLRAYGGRAARCCWTTSARVLRHAMPTAPCSPG